MAKRKRRVSTRKKTSKRRGGKKLTTVARKKAANRTVRKAVAKKVAKPTPRKRVGVPKESPTQAAAITEEAVVDIIEEPAPGVMSSPSYKQFGQRHRPRAKRALTKISLLSFPCRNQDTPPTGKGWPGSRSQRGAGASCEVQRAII